MPDMLVRLYELPPLAPALAAADAAGVTVRRALVAERPQVTEWVQARFPPWRAEVEAAFCRQPVGCFIAARQSLLIGFACIEATAPNFFGPSAVAQDERGRGIGRALLLAALHAQRAMGYGYAIIGGVGPAGFYAKTVGAQLIAGSSPGIYGGRLGSSG
jgi:GNAT superfamily N-acetyltransferase